jgi:hypothetical protein
MPIYRLGNGNAEFPSLGTVSVDILGASPLTIFGPSLPIGPGVYGMNNIGAQSGGIASGWSTDYTWTFKVDPAVDAVPEPGSLLLCATGGETRFKAVAPVAASRYCTRVMPIPVMYIQGMMDAMRGNANGMDLVNVFTSSNMCSGGATPYASVPTCMSKFDRMTVTPGCVSYPGCAKPTFWCSHDDPQYGGTSHGVPCFAITAMHDFFGGLPSACEERARPWLAIQTRRRGVR